MNFVSNWIKLFKHCTSVEFLLVKGYVQGTLQKELLIAPLTECALKQLLWEGLTDAFCQYLEPFTKTLRFCWIFAGGRLFIECSTNGASHYSFRRALWNSYFGKVLPMNFASTWNNLLKNWISSEFLQMEDYVEGALQKDLHIVLFVERFKTTTLRKHHL